MGGEEGGEGREEDLGGVVWVGEGAHLGEKFRPLATDVLEDATEEGDTLILMHFLM